jgi:hypothetical protein
LLLVSCWFLAWLFFDPENWEYMFLRNVGWISTDYTTLYLRIYNFSFCLLEVRVVPIWIMSLLVSG